MCGGTRSCRRGPGSGKGLSPRVRGNRFLSHIVHKMSGSIPACAGEPLRYCETLCCRWVYPRVCGGTRRPRHINIRACGLSPRVRGNPGIRIRYEAFLRSIPACAGEPGANASFAGQHSVYPRVCGGTSFRRCQSSCPKGLSPRVRGNPFPPSAEVSSCGSIPACAGEPVCRIPYLDEIWVYPRVCGGTIHRSIRHYLI